MYKILISDKLGQAGLDRLDKMDDVSYDMITGMSKAELMEILPAYDGLIIRSGTSPDADIIAAGTKLKVIGRAGIGVDNIDLVAATEHGVKVLNTPRANSVATAEQTMTLMLALCRHTVQSHNSVANGEWARAKYMGTEIAGKTLGVIGFGYIGRLVASRAKAFGMNLLAADPYISETQVTAMGGSLVELPELLSKADIITLHSVVTPETTNMINAEAIAQMKDGAMIINVARGKLIEEQALAEALQSGKLAGTALDVYQQEPPVGSPLLGLPNVIHTPHLGASSKEAQTRVGVEIVEQVVDALKGIEFRNVVNV